MMTFAVFHKVTQKHVFPVMNEMFVKGPRVMKDMFLDV